MLFSELPLIAICPFERPDARLVVAACRAGALGVLDLGRDRERARDALHEVARRVPGGFGVRIPAGVAFDPGALPEPVAVVVLSGPTSLRPWKQRRILVQCVTLEEARAAQAAGANGIIAKGAESGGRVSGDSSFILSQQILAQTDLPVWVQGGIGLHTAAACVAGGAAGAVLDSQLALVREASLPEPIRAGVAAMDGSETVLLGGGIRVFTRPDLPLERFEGASDAALLAALGGDDLQTQLLPVGQDGAFAAPLAERFHTAGGVITGIHRAIDAHLREASRSRPLAPGSSLAESYGLTYPIVQGPMTRVSDSAAFADAIASAGGLPFLALSLSRGPQCRELIRATQERLGQRPFGVGILGFVPPSLRQEQLAVLQELKPPVALIAGGRPSQARPLEAQGTRTFLHVPSPGLLDLFLKDGARRFVFEGRECGGHVGPRSSFALWEAQIERLLKFPKPGELELLFAGGIHDARSAAMVSAMAAPLAALGAKIGVVMGTAYLFTEEIVRSGAVLPGFQKAALGCERTVLLETAPGHATRCVETGYVRSFRQEKARLESEEQSPQEVWAALEQLNLGRLRLAAKGIKRVGSALVEVPADEQVREGMFMIGQVATLRDKVLTVEALHQDVSAGGTRLLRQAQPLTTHAAPPPCDVAIVGMACVYPGAPDLQTYWGNVVLGRNAIREVPRERWNADIYYDPESNDGTKTPSKWGGFLDPLTFDPLEYGIPPRSLAAIEPIQLLALQMAKRALEDAGYGSREFDRENTSVIFGAEAGTDLAGAYGFRNLYPQIAGELPEALDQVLPRLTEDSFPGVLANVIAGRIANRLDLGGANYTVDAACGSSLAATDLAVKELVQGTSSMVLCGGADLHNTINDFLLFASTHALSRVGQCQTFDAHADGIALGEGVACVVLKRLADAERDGDRVYAVIKGVGASSDGRSLGLTAPRKDGQKRSLERAYRRAGVSPADVGLVEAHGTGTVVGDRTEMATLTEIYQAAGVEPGTVALGSVKSNIGHTKCAAGMAGLIKVALSLHHKVLPPTLNIKEPNPYWKPDSSPFVFDATARPWLGADRAAAVSAFGFGGTNFHAVVTEHVGWEEPGVGFDAWPAELFLFRGKDREGAARRMERLAHLLATEDAWRLRDLARSTNQFGGSEHPVQVAVVADDLADLRTKLTQGLKFEPSPKGVFVRGAAAGGKMAFLFPGQGSQRPGMLSELFVAFPELQSYLELGEEWVDRLFPPAAWTPKAEADQLQAITDTRVAQPTLGMVDLAMAQVLARLGLRPDMMGGHSYGELVALCVSGALSEADLLTASAARAAAILGAAGDDPGTMAAVKAGAEVVTAAISGLDDVVLANLNAPEQTVISGPTASIEAAVARLKAAGLRAKAIPVACAFHSGVVAGARESFAAHLAEVEIGALGTPVWSNTHAAPYVNTPEAIAETMAQHVVMPVRFVEQIRAMWEDGARVFVECGPGRVLTGLVEQVLGDRDYVAVATDRGRGSTLRHLQMALAELAVAGVAVNTAGLYQGRDAALFDCDYPPAVGPSPTAWWVDGHRARPVRGELPDAGMVPILEPVLDGSASVARGGVGHERDSVMLDYLSTMRKLVDTQREVMLSYLGRHPAPLLASTGLSVSDAVMEGAVVEDAVVVEEDAAAISIQDALLGVVSERTGYPVEMLDLDLDLEADLSIDSIKRIEILGVLGEQLGMGEDDGGSRDHMIEELAGIKTLSGIIAWLEEHQAGLGDERAADEPAGDERAADQTVAGADEGAIKAAPVVATETLETPPLQRFVLEVAAAPETALADVPLGAGSVVIVADGLGAGAALAARLKEQGTDVALMEPGAIVETGAAALVYLAALAPLDRSPILPMFETLRAAAEAGTARILVGTGLGGAFGRTSGGQNRLWGGANGMVKTFAKEYPGARIQLVDLDPSEPAAVLAAQLHTELLSGDAEVEVGYRAGARQILSVVKRAVPRPNGAAQGLSPDAVVLLTGGARGITARVAIALASRFGCKLELVGRSPAPGPADPALGGAESLADIRRRLVARGALKSPKAIEKAASRAWADAQMRATFQAIEAAGAEVTYHAADVRDRAAFGALVDEIYARHGRLDGVVHGAGVLEDGLAKSKTAESFSRVFETKVVGAQTLAERLREGVRFVVFFSSVSGAFGNRGQVDYSAANDALDKLALSLNERLSARVVSINWGPWGGEGMVSAELQREYARRGIGLIEPEGGVEALVDELIDTARHDPQVIYMSADPEAMR